MMEVADPEVTLFSCEEQIMQLVHDSVSTRKFPWDTVVSHRHALANCFPLSMTVACPA
jgi:hypothetical protein